MPLLTDWQLPPADIHIVFATRSQLSPRIRALVDFLIEVFETHRGDAMGDW